MPSDPQEKFDRLMKKSHQIAREVERLAKEMGDRAERWIKYGVGNPERDEEVVKAHEAGIVRQLELAKELEEAAAEAGFVPRKEEKE